MKPIVYFVALLLIQSSAGLMAAPSDSLRGLNLNVPTVAGTANVSNPVEGELVYDTTDDTFYGRDASDWVRLNSPVSRYQTKYLSSNVTSDGAMSDMTFSLEADKTYRINFQASFETTSTDPAVTVFVKDGSTIIARLGDYGAGGTDDIIVGTSHIHKMVGSSLTFVAASASTNARVMGDGTASNTFAQVEELHAHETTTDW